MSSFSDDGCICHNICSNIFRKSHSYLDIHHPFALLRYIKVEYWKLFCIGNNVNKVADCQRIHPIIVSSKFVKHFVVLNISVLLKISNDITSWICCIIQYYTNLRCGQVIEQGGVLILITRPVRLERDQNMSRLFRCGAYAQPAVKGPRLSGYLSNTTLVHSKCSIQDNL